MKRALAIATIGLIAGCFPYIASYLHLDAEGVAHLPTRCGSALPPALATYERDGVRFDVTLEPRAGAISQAGFLRVRAPQKMTVSIPNPTAHISETGGSFLSFSMRAVQHPENRAAVEPLARKGLSDHYFDFFGVPSIPSSGTLVLPTVHLDGVPVIAPVFKLERRPHVAIAPLNC